MRLEATNQCLDQRAAAADGNTPGKSVNESRHVENERARSLLIRSHEELGGALQQMDFALVVMEILVDDVEHALLHDMHQLPPRGALVQQSPERALWLRRNEHGPDDLRQ